MQSMTMMPQPHVLQMLRHKRQAGEEGETETNSQAPPLNYDEGPHPLISDSLFSLIIFIYVSITFLYMFYAFCWRAAENKPMPDNKDLPMVTDLLDQVEAQSNGQEKKEAV
eukprot:TRINITY_DN16640_c0_g1_i5.p1 TRINITY_DN16640_c0_g1~~TRINITY_DN16640_c0_g1_i5.p1  ORF type:complete len:111 (-),score=47.39 TRINITY_DN16640_c0_g1_i5:205-537(-)